MSIIFVCLLRHSMKGWLIFLIPNEGRRIWRLEFAQWIFIGATTAGREGGAVRLAGCERERLKGFRSLVLVGHAGIRLKKARQAFDFLFGRYTTTFRIDGARLNHPQPRTTKPTGSKLTRPSPPKAASPYFCRRAADHAFAMTSGARNQDERTS
jgi:hypothetical protein